VCGGIGCSLVLAALAAKVIAPYLFSVSRLDPLAFAAISVVFTPTRLPLGLHAGASWAGRRPTSTCRGHSRQFKRAGIAYKSAQ
jgi:hypothetical protein